VSNTVQQIMAAIKQKKVQLAPAIQELRGLRQQQQVLYMLARTCVGSYSWCDSVSSIVTAAASGVLKRCIAGLAYDTCLDGC
jgi:hypothetical protein